ncbi:hypothetical protein [Trinickia symbiotica]|uniref:hypothetical protein n=1 Tax=Trinickia symbiotica TaxID=863227 RepID=UPI0011B212E9|nr:hypothetical protein [Trinickia symbiotica]
MQRHHPYQMRASAPERRFAEPVQDQEGNPFAGMFLRRLTRTPSPLEFGPESPSALAADEGCTPSTYTTLQPPSASNHGQAAGSSIDTFDTALRAHDGQFESRPWQYVPGESLANDAGQASHPALTDFYQPVGTEAIPPQHAVPLPHPFFDHEVTQRTKSEPVDPEQKYLLDIGDEIIASAKSAFLYGSGNHRFIKPGSHQRVGFAYQTTRDLTPHAFFAKPRSGMLVAATAQAANCDHMAMFAYSQARILLSSEYVVEIAQMPGHTFCRIGKAYWTYDRCVIVDPWPKHAYAVVGKDHFSHGKSIDVVRSKYAKGTTHAPEKDAKYASLIRSAKEALRHHLANNPSDPKNEDEYNAWGYNVLYPTPPDSAFRRIHYQMKSESEDRQE